MTYRVIQWATGQLGRAAVAGIAAHPELELVGGWVHSEDKDGKDLGEIAGVGPLGVRASRDKEALLATPADCVCFMTANAAWHSDPTGTVEELVRILRSGKNVVNAAWPALVHPAGVSAELYEKLQAACLEGGASFYTDGIDPGYGNLGLAISALHVVGEVNTVHTYEIANYANYVNDEMWLLGFGQTDVEKCVFLRQGYVTSIFGSTVKLLAKAMNIEVEALVEDRSVIHAEETFDIAMGPIPKGTISGMRFSVSGLVGGKPRVIVEHVTRLRDQDYAELDFPGHGYRVEVDGEPCVRLDMDLSSHKGDAVHAAFYAGAMAVVNAIPKVCAAPPGVLTFLDLLPHPSTNVARG
jgi:4-hydroxy-tetrahydrodipicolinate reductase